MTPTAIAELCQLLAQAERWPLACEQIRQALGASAFTIDATPPGPPDPAASASTRWEHPVLWAGAPVGVVRGEGPHDPAVLDQVLPLIAWAMWQARESQQLESRVNEVQVRAARAMDLSELVTWLLHARDEVEVEKLGTSAVASVLKVDAGALLTKDRLGVWTLRIPVLDLATRLDGLGASKQAQLLTRALVELEGPVNPDDGPVEWRLWEWGYRHAFAVPLDSGTEPLGVLLALSKEPGVIDAEARVAAAQLAIMISVALDRLHDQRGLAEHRKALEDALRLASMGTWELELATLEVTWSKELHQLYGGGFTELRLSHDATLEGLAPDDRFLYERHLRELLGTGTTTPCQTQLTTLDDRHIWVRTLFELVRDADGVPTRVRAVTRDVTPEVGSQLDRERALARASRYERLFSLSDTLSAVMDSNGVIEECSPSWTRQLGYAPNELQGTNMVALLHPADRPEVERLLRERMKEGQPAGAVSRVKARAGDWRWLSWTTARDGGRFYAAATDVTPLEATSQRLRRSEEQLRQAGALARVGAWEFELATERITCSDEVLRIYELPRGTSPSLEEFMGFYSPEDAAKFTSHIRECGINGTPYDLELEILTRSGKRLWARHQGQADRVNGHTLRVFGALQDITDQRRARETAIAASRVKSQFLANTSHEIRTPLNGILGMTELALETQLTPEQREFLDAVRVSGQNLLSIVNDILDISKIESGHLQLERVPFSLHTAIFEAVRNQASRSHSRGLELLVDLDPALPDQFLGDPVRVGQVVTNLVGNAVKFTERGEVIVEASLEARGVRLAVRDTGIGIPPDRIESIFEAFTQADGSTNRRFGGTGLGLTITLELVKAMGGRIDVESVVGKGSTFVAWLPLATAPAEPRLAPAATGLKVMVVSDHPAVRAVTERQLHALGYEVETTTASSAIHRLLDGNGAVHAMVIDQELEHSSGIELSQALEHHEGLNRLPRVLSSRTTSRPSHEEITAAGVRRVLTRPVSCAELKGALNQARLAGASPTRQASSSAASQLRPAPRALKVLLAEDNAINARLAQRLVERLGHRVTHVTDGAQAVDAVAREKWDAVLMDMQMPVLDGLDATRRIRQAERTTGGHVPIIALTANAMKGDDQACLDAGMDAYLTKPIDLDRLAETLDTFVVAAITEMTA